jgi:hypothetical protein
MSLEIKNGELPPELRDFILGNKCVVFIGSGPSIPYYGSWHELVNNLCAACGQASRFTADSPSSDLLEAAQQARNADSKAYKQHLRGHFGKYVPHAPRLYDLLLSVDFKCYLTVAFDSLLLRQARTREPSSKFFAYPAIERGHVVLGRSIIHLHGYIGDGCQSNEPSIVLTKDEFDDAYEDNGIVSNLLVPTLENDPIIFIGCRLQEPVMTRVFAICKKHQQHRLRCQLEGGLPESKPPGRYILLPFPTPTQEDGTTKRDEVRQAEDEKHYRNMDIETVWYPSDDDHACLHKSFEQLAGYKAPKPYPGWGEETNVF